MSENFSPTSVVPGFKDLLPREQEFFTYIKKVIRHRCRQAGFRRISTPFIENYSLYEEIFKKNPDFLNKLYVYQEGESKLVLKADDSIGIGRAYISNKLNELAQPVQLYYFEPNFTKKNLPKTLNCHYEFGVEIIGEEDPALEVQSIHLAYKVLQDLGISALYKLNISTLGCEECQSKYLKDLENFYVGKERSLCSNCRDNLSNDLLALQSCPEEDCRILAEIAPPIKNYWCKSCQQKLEDLKSYLNVLKIPFAENHKLTRVKSYHSGLIFQFLNNKEYHYKKNEPICFGGQYNKLILKLGGQDTPAMGFVMEVEKIIESMRKEKIKVPSKDNIHIFVAQLGRAAKEKSLLLTDQLREAGIKTVGTLGKGSMREQLSIAERFKAPYMLIMGITEVRENTIIVREMKIGTQRIIKFDDVMEEIKRLIGEKELDTYTPGELLY